MEKNDLQYVYKEEFADITQAQYGMGELIWMDLKYVRNGQTIQVKAFPLFDISSFKDLAYYNKNWEAHKTEVRNWLEWFQNYASNIIKIDEDYIKQNERERWDIGELDYKKDNYKNFDEYWKTYVDSPAYWDEVSFMQQISWDDLKNEMEYEYKVINDAIQGDWFDSYDNMNTYKMDNGLEEAFDMVEELVQDLIDSEYKEDDFSSYEELARHLDWIFE